MSLQVYSPLHPAVRVCGRTLLREPLPLFWTGAGVEFITDATALAFDFETDFTTREQWIRIEVDGVSLLRTPLPQGKSRFWVWREMMSAARHHVRLYKEVQPMPRDPRSALLLCGICCDGALYPAPQPACKIEFVGDSLSAGEGLGGGASLRDGVSAVFSTQSHYAVETARRLNADFRILAQSGWGVYVGWDNDPAHTMPPLYEQVCGVAVPDAQDFSSWQPDIVVAHLGHNDFFAMSEPPFTAKDGMVYKLRAEPDGSPCPETRQKVADSTTAFLHKLRRCNPKAQLVWAYGMLGHTMLPAICDGLECYRRETQENVPLVLLPEFLPEQLGSNNHPGPAAHLAAADVLTAKLQELLQKRS